MSERLTKVAILTNKMLELEAENARLKAQVKKWEDQEVRKASCCSDMEEENARLKAERDAADSACSYAVNVVFSSAFEHPGPESQFVELEDDCGNGLDASEWKRREDGCVVLRILLRTLQAHALVQENARLRDLLRWRKTSKEKPDGGFVLVKRGESGSIFDAGRADASIDAGRYPYWRPLGPLPGDTTGGEG